jgi:hypothetical protein
MRNTLLKIPGAIKRRVWLAADYLLYIKHARPYRALMKTMPEAANGSLMIISGRGMNISWAQIWALLSLSVRRQGYRGLVLTTRRQRLLNRYFTFLGLELVFLDDHPISEEAPLALASAIKSAQSYEAYTALTHKNAPVGQIALSTYSRHKGTGLIDYDDSTVRTYINAWVGRICSAIDNAEKLYDQYSISMLFFTEVFMEEYGAFYYAALNKKLNIIRFAGTIRDNAFIMQHLSHANDRIHHSSIDPTTWEALKRREDDTRIETELMQNFSDRYGNKWHRSKRNHPDTKQLDVASARTLLGVTEGRKVAVIYSHILYDTLFFFGTDLFEDYSKWLVETVRAAIENPHVDWLIKVHPSNLWRGEVDSLLKGRYEEERLLRDQLGELPPHVRIIGADTKINPFTWFQLADYGITVRGTSGLEMAALGKTVITAGTGRYEGNGFTYDPKSSAEYLVMLKQLHTLPTITPEQSRLAKRYAHAIFALKPYTLTSLTPRLKAGCKVVHASDDLIYLPAPISANQLPNDLVRFGEWAVRTDQRDLLSDFNETTV